MVKFTHLISKEAVQKKRFMQNMYSENFIKAYLGTQDTRPLEHLRHTIFVIYLTLFHGVMKCVFN